ncbi:hypothetical protein FJZ31_36210 [Candidatus Poribacteria bacterium]|nr:hypothetical protein [Candidatus Poribacteria bacterium]
MEKQPPQIKFRAVFLGVSLIIANCYWISYVEMIWHTAHLTIIALPVNVMFSVLLLTWINLAIRQVVPRASLSQQELLTVYAMLAVGSAFAGHDCIPRLMGLMPYAFRYATPENDWEALFYRFLPKWLVVNEPRTVRNFYEGETNFFTEAYVQHWLVPILSWSVVVFLLLLVFLCLTVILRKQWVARERLAYPIVQVPYEITSTSTDLFRNKVLWIGFGIAAGIDLLNGLQYFFPVLPSIPVMKYDLGIYFTQKPWNAIGSTPLRFHPFLIGLAFLIPLDLSFSVAFFYLLRKVQQVMGSMTGVSSAPGFPFFGEQGTGALIALVVVVLWGGKRHLAHVFTGIFRSRGLDEPISYRSAVILLALCTLLFMGFCLKAGMSAWVFLIFLGFYLAIVVGITRMRAELGPPIHAIGYVSPQYFMISLLGTRRLRAGNLTMLSLLNWLSGSTYAAFRTHPMPHQMEAFKLAERAQINHRTMFFLLVLACAVGIVGSLVLYPYVIYKEGVAAGSEQILAGGSEAYNFLASWLTIPQATDFIGISVMAVTFSANLVMMFMRARFVWFPLHPAGYVIGVAPGTTDNYWFTLLLTTIIKWLILRHGGIKAYRQAIPFFIGLVLGEALMGCFWPAISLILRTSVYSWI